MLSKINELTGGESLQLNQQLIQHNALIGAQVAVEYSNVLQGISKASSLSTPTPRQCSHRIPVVIGGSVYDIVAKADRSSSFVKVSLFHFYYFKLMALKLKLEQNSFIMLKRKCSLHCNVFL